MNYIGIDIKTTIAPTPRMASKCCGKDLTARRREVVEDGLDTITENA